MNIKHIPAKDDDSLRGRVNSFIDQLSVQKDSPAQKSLFPHEPAGSFKEILKFKNSSNTATLKDTLDYFSILSGPGDLYIFGGILRDLALFGKRGFNSDIDLVIEKNWDLVEPELKALGAVKNKFGGYRFKVQKQDIDIWPAQETWAIKNRFVQFRGISSLLDSTVLNWDAILLNWRTKLLLRKPDYFEQISSRHMDLVLEQNPNPIGMLVRVIRHLTLKDASSIGFELIHFLNRATNLYPFEAIHLYEKRSYGIGNCIIDRFSYDKLRLNDFSILSFKIQESGFENEVTKRQLTYEF